MPTNPADRVCCEQNIICNALRLLYIQMEDNYGYYIGDIKGITPGSGL